jgi:small subunit ribosomal protein S6
VTFIAFPTLSKEEVDPFVDQLVKTVESRKGKILKIDKLGKRNLAYKIDKYKEGYYVILTLEADGGIIAELERRLKVTDFIIRFLSVRVDEDAKRLEKIKAKRMKRIKQPVSSSAETHSKESAEA